MKLINNIFAASISITTIGLTLTAHAYTITTPSNCLKHMSVIRGSQLYAFDYDSPSSIGFPSLGEVAIYDPTGPFVTFPLGGCIGSERFCCAILDLDTDEVIIVYRKD